MDDLGIKSGSGLKPSTFAGTEAKGAKSGGIIASLGGLAATFTDLVHKMGSRMNADVSGVTANAGFAASSERAQEPAPYDNRDRRDDRGRDRVESRGRSDEPRNERSDTGRTDRTDRTDQRPHDRSDNDSEPTTPTRTDNRDSGVDDRQSDTTNRVGDDKPNDADKDGSSDHYANAENSDGQSDKSGTADGDSSAQNSGETVTQTNDQPGVSANAAHQTAQQIIAGMTADLQGAGQTGHTAQDGKAQSGESAQGDKTLQNFAAIASAEGKGNTATKAGVHQAEHGQQTQAGVQKAGEDQNKGQAQAQMQNQNQGKTGAEGENRNAAADAVKVTDGATRQAAELSRIIGGEDRARIQVSVKDEAAALVSKPAATLAPTSVGAAETAVPAQHGQQAAAGAAQASAAAAQQGPGQSAQQMSSQQAASQNNQIQAAGGEAKGPAQAGVHAGQGSQASTSAGGEQQASAGTSQTSETAQAQKAQAAQATAASQRPQVHNQGFVDQISVKITKALHAGMDKINIQLRPASLGRIDVQLEVGHDGRLSAVITADNKDTLDMLQRDARGLEKALQDAGLQADAGSMSFNLRKQGDGGQDAPESTVRGDVIGNDDEDGEDRLETILSAERNRNGINPDGRIDFWA